METRIRKLIIISFKTIRSTEDVVRKGATRDSSSSLTDSLHLTWFTEYIHTARRDVYVTELNHR
jgi:hypothetical protein